MRIFRVLFLGDIIGATGRSTLKEFMKNNKLNTLEQEDSESRGSTREEVHDLIIANGENIAGGVGLTPKTVDEIFSAGVDVITSGNHIYDKKEIVEYLSKSDRVIRPANMPPGNPGIGWCIIEKRNVEVAVINLQGRVFCSMPLDCPFRKADELLKSLSVKIKIVDFHADATAEKIAMGYYLAGRVSAVIGTHTRLRDGRSILLSYRNEG
jgi:hypothetical protein